MPEFENPLTRSIVRLYRPLVHFALARPGFTLLTAALAVASCLPIIGRLGGEFLPRIDEGDLLFMPTTLPGVTIEQASQDLRQFDRAIGAFKEVAAVFGKVGRADTATDPAPASMAEITVRLRPQSEWPKVIRPRWYSAWAPAGGRRILGLVWPEETLPTTAELVERLESSDATSGLDELVDHARPRAPRHDVDRCSNAGRYSHRRRESIAPRRHRQRAPRDDGARARHSKCGVRVVWTGDTPRVCRRRSSDGSARRGSGARSIDDRFAAHRGSRSARFERDGRRLRLVVVPELRVRGQADDIRDVTVRATEHGAEDPVPLALLGHPEFAKRPAMIRSERGEEVAYVYVDLEEGTDLALYVKRAQRELSETLARHEITLGPQERIEWSGQYELLTAGQRRLWWIVPLVVTSMLGLLFLQFRSIAEALLVLLSVPFALVGSLWTLFLLGYPMSAPVWIGLLSVVGLAMQTGVVMVVYIDEAFYRRVREGTLISRDDIVAAHAEGTVRRLRPKIMTITTMAAGLLPLLWSDGAGAEIMKRIAAPMIGGLASSAFPHTGNSSGALHDLAKPSASSRPALRRSRLQRWSGLSRRGHDTRWCSSITHCVARTSQSGKM